MKILVLLNQKNLFPLPTIALDLNANLENQMINNSDSAQNIINNDHRLGPIYAPISMFLFHRPFTNEEYFMIKLCFLCNKANVPHHIVDDIVALLRDCKRHNIDFHPEQLLTGVHFLKHLESHLKSNIPQSIVIGMEDCSGNDLQYSRG